MIVVRAQGGWGKHKELPRTPPKPRGEHKAGTEQASRTNVSDQCEVPAKCERTLELPPNAEMGAPRADGKSEKAEYGKYNDLTELLETEPTAQTKNFLPSSFRLAAGGLGGAAKK